MQIWGYYWMFGKLLSAIKLKKWQFLAFIVVILIFWLLYAYYTREQPTLKRHQKIVQVEYKQLSIPIYCNGIIEPIHIFNIVSPVEGIINNMFFKYGEHINVDQKLFSISAEKLEKEYVDSISNYLRAMDDYSEKLRKFKGTEELWKLQFVSDNDYYADKIAKEESFFMLKQAVKNLKNTLAKIGIKRDLREIDIQNQKVVEEIIMEKLDNYIISSPYFGIAMDPKSLRLSNKEDTAKGVGYDIKQGEVILHIGDLRGFAVDVKISETDINHIKSGQKAIVTGPGFSELRLDGEVEFVKSQAHTDSVALPTFPVRIVVKKLTDEQHKKIKIGMSAKVEIKITNKQAIMVPIEAIFQNQGQDFIQVKHKKTGKIIEVPVVLGHATVDAIEVEKGLNPGDQIVIDY